MGWGCGQSICMQLRSKYGGISQLLTYLVGEMRSSRFDSSNFSRVKTALRWAATVMIQEFPSLLQDLGAIYSVRQ